MSHDLVMDAAPLPPQLDRSSQDFLEVVRTGDRTRLDALLARHLGEAHAQARRLLGSASEADDAVQEAALQLLRTAWRYDARVPFAAWFAQLVHVAAVRERRTAMRRRQREGIAGSAPVPTSTSTSSEGEIQERVRLALARIPTRDQEALDLHYIAGLDQSACAAALGTSLSAMSSRIARARERLRTQLSASGTSCAIATITQTLAAPHADPSAQLAAAVRAAIDRGTLTRHASWGARLLHAARALTGGGVPMAGIAAALLVLAGLLALAQARLAGPTPDGSQVRRAPVQAPSAAVADQAPPPQRPWQGPARALLWDIQPHDALTAGIDIDALRDRLLATRLATDPDLTATWARLRTLLQDIGEDSPRQMLGVFNDMHGLVLSTQIHARAQDARPQHLDIGLFADLGSAGPPTHVRLDQNMHSMLTRCGSYDAFALPSLVIGVHGSTLAIASLERLTAASAREQAQPPIPPEWMRDPVWLDCDLRTLPMLEAPTGDGREPVPSAWYSTGAASLHLSATPTTDGVQGALAISGITMPLSRLDRRYAELVDEHGVASVAVHADLPMLLAAGLDRLSAPLAARCGLTAAQLGQRLDGQLAMLVESTSPWSGTIALGIVPGQELAEPLGRLMQVLGGTRAGHQRWSIGSPLGTLTVALTRRDLLISNAPDLDQVSRRLDQGAAGTATEALVAQADTGSLARAGLAALAQYLHGRRIVASLGFMEFPMRVVTETGEIQVMEGNMDAMRTMTLNENFFPMQPVAPPAPHTTGTAPEAPKILGASDFLHAHMGELCGHALVWAAASAPGRGSRCLAAVRVREGFAVSESAVDANGTWHHGDGVVEVLDADALNRRMVAEGLQVVHGDVAHATPVAGMPALALFDESDLPDANALARHLPRYRARIERQGDRLTIAEDGLPLLAMLPLARCLVGLPAAIPDRQSGPHMYQLPPGTIAPGQAAPHAEF